MSDSMQKQISLWVSIGSLITMIITISTLFFNGGKIVNIVQTQEVNTTKLTSTMEKLQDRQTDDEITLAKHEERITAVESTVKNLINK